MTAGGIPWQNWCARLIRAFRQGSCNRQERCKEVGTIPAFGRGDRRLIESDEIVGFYKILLQQQSRLNVK
jgi:hypothetical protein